MTAVILLVWSATQPPPAPPAADVPVRQLRTELRDAARERFDLLVKDGKSLEEGASAAARLADAEAALGDPAAAAKVAERWFEAVTAREKLLREVYDRGGNLAELLDILTARVEAEVALIRRREAVPGGPRTDPARTLAVHTERVKLRTRHEEWVAEMVAKGTASRAELLAARVARLEAAVELAKLKDATADKK
jgi:hypothetical protein